MTAFPSLSELNSIAETMGLRTTKRACPSEQVRSDIYSALIVIDQGRRKEVGRPLRGNPLSSPSAMEPVSAVSTKGFDQAQESER
jgi:hypothetical protein